MRLGASRPRTTRPNRLTPPTPRPSSGPIGRRAPFALLASALLLTVLAGCGARRLAAPPLERAAAPDQQPVVVAPPTPPATTAVPAPPTTAKPPPARPAPAPAGRAAAPSGRSGVRGESRVGGAGVRFNTPGAPGRFEVAAYGGLGTWIDVFDWSRTYTQGHPTVGPADVDTMASEGVQTLYVQTGHADYPGDVVDPDLLAPIIARAHARGIRVVAWYLPTLEDPATDLRRILAGAGLGVEGVTVDIEARNVTDVNERNRRLLALAADLRRSLPGRAIGAAVLPPVVLEVINPNYWPGFPWAGLAPDFDVWLPMSYWTNRTPQSGYRDAYRYTAENITRLRHDLNQPTAAVHTIGGIADRSTPDDVDGMVRAGRDTGVVGASLYDWRTTGPALWPHLQAERR